MQIGVCFGVDFQESSFRNELGEFSNPVLSVLLFQVSKKIIPEGKGWVSLRVSRTHAALVNLDVAHGRIIVNEAVFWPIG